MTTIVERMGPNGKEDAWHEEVVKQKDAEEESVGIAEHNIA